MQGGGSPHGSVAPQGGGDAGPPKVRKTWVEALKDIAEKTMDTVKTKVEDVLNAEPEGPQRISTTSITKVANAPSAAKLAAQAAPKTKSSTLAAFFGTSNTLKDYDIGAQLGSGGVGMAWKLLAGTKKSTKEDVTIFVFDKNRIEKLAKAQQEAVLETVKKEASQIARLRHPDVVKVLSPVEETRTSLVYVTEPVMCSLANALHNYANLPTVPQHLRDFELTELEAKLGLLQLAQALNFCHQDAKLIHRNISPESVFITPKGAWKLGGFGYSCFLGPESSIPPPKFEWDESCMTTTISTQPPLAFCAPEVASGSTTYGFPADIFALGCLTYSLYNGGSPPVDCAGNLVLYNKQVKEVEQLELKNVPKSITEALRSLLVVDPSKRPDAKQFMASPYFNDIMFKALRYVDTLLEKDSTSKIQFFKALFQLLPKFDLRILKNRMLNPLLLELRNSAVVPFVLPNVLWVADRQDADEFASETLPYLIPVISNVSTAPEHVHTLFVLLRHLDLLAAKSTPDAIRDYILPMLYKSYESDAAEVQEEAIKHTILFAEKVEYHILKNSILPRIQGLVLQAANASVRINALVCVSKLLPLLDKGAIESVIIPCIEKCLTLDKSSQCLMCVLGVYEAIGKQLGPETAGLKLLPTLIPLTYERGLDLKQFEVFMTVIKDMVAGIEKKRALELQETQRFDKDVPLSGANGAAVTVGVKKNAQNGKKTDPDKGDGEWDMFDFNDNNTNTLSEYEKVAKKDQAAPPAPSVPEPRTLTLPNVSPFPLAPPVASPSLPISQTSPALSMADLIPSTVSAAPPMRPPTPTFPSPPPSTQSAMSAAGSQPLPQPPLSMQSMSLAAMSLQKDTQPQSQSQSQSQPPSHPYNSIAPPLSSQSMYLPPSNSSQRPMSIPMSMSSMASQSSVHPSASAMPPSFPMQSQWQPMASQQAPSSFHGYMTPSPTTAPAPSMSVMQPLAAHQSYRPLQNNALASLYASQQQHIPQPSSMQPQSQFPYQSSMNQLDSLYSQAEKKAPYVQPPDLTMSPGGEVPLSSLHFPSSAAFPANQWANGRS
mmetsp:Transcript_43917/g.71412  ORF Transcript_43917/g.71412 Transcript_43917/m.71412 type:complete len:1056 (-) Transcript_43917:1151-4318(-)